MGSTAPHKRSPLLANPKIDYTPLLGERSARGQQIASIGSPVTLCNTDSKTAQTTPYDVYKHLSGNGNSDKVIPLIIDEGSYLYVWHAFTGTSEPSTSPIIRAFGLKRAPVDGKRYWPRDFDSTNFPTDLNATALNIASVGDARGFWVPLTDPTTGAGDQTLPTIGLQVNAVWSLSKPVRFHLEGCRKAVVFVSTAAVGPTAGVLVAGLVG